MKNWPVPRSLSLFKSQYKVTQPHSNCVSGSTEGSPQGIPSCPSILPFLMLKVKVLVAQSCPTLCDPMDCSRQAPQSMGFSRQEYYSGLPFPSPGDLPDSGIIAGLLTCRWILYRLSYMGSPHGSLVPKMLGTVALGDKEALKKSEEGSDLFIRGKVEDYMGGL